MAATFDEERFAGIEMRSEEREEEKKLHGNKKKSRGGRAFRSASGTIN